MSRHFELSLPDILPDLAVLFAALNDSTREWREELGDVTVEQLQWQPYPNGPSIGAQLMHIAHVELFWFEVRVAGRKISKEESAKFLGDVTDVDAGVWPTPPDWTLADYYRELDLVRERTLAVLKEVKDSSGIRRSTNSDWSYTVNWILSHVVEHDSYHGGQAVLLKALWEGLAKPA